jgi:hypothetical protein
MTTTISLHQLALDAVVRSNLDEFPAFKQQLREAVDQEREAASKHSYSIKAAKGGIDEFTIYFDVEGDSGDPESWQVAEGLQAFYKGVEITKLFDGCDLEEDIYLQSNVVEEQMADAWADHMIDKYADCD